MIYFSICSRKDKKPKSLDKLIKWIRASSFMDYSIAYDASSIYDGHNYNIQQFNKRGITDHNEGQHYRTGLTDNDIIVMCHDDLEILSTHAKVIEYLSLANASDTGFVGLAGATAFGNDGAWWNARNTGEARGFVFQGDDMKTAAPNYFGPAGEVVVLDGIFLAITYKNLQKIKLKQPSYLSDGWDYYDIHLTFTAHRIGKKNYTVPIVAMHESRGEMRSSWHTVKEEFMNVHGKFIPYRIPYKQTTGLPNIWNT